MRTLHAATAAMFVLLLSAWIPLRSVDKDAVVLDRTLATLDQLTMIENALDRDVLSARVGMLRNYDPIAREEDAISTLIGHLRQQRSAAADQVAAIDRMAVVADQQTSLVEAFKSNNALLQNSLAYFQLFSDQLGTADDPRTVAAVRALDAAMLRLTLDTSPAAAQELSDRLGELTALAPPAAKADARAGLLAHAGLLRVLLPRTDGTLKTLHAVPLKAEQDRLRAIVLARQAVSQLWSERLRLLLYAACIILFVLLVYVARNLRARARALRERAAFDHAVASISMNLVTASPTEIATQIDRALAAFAALFGADRAYFLQIGRGPRSQSWQRDEAPPPVEWLATVPGLMANGNGIGVIHVPHPGRSPAGPVRDGLMSAGIAGWLAMASAGSDGTRRILGFDALQPGRITEPDDLGFARAALDVLVNAEEKQALEQERARLDNRLQQARRMETVGALASGIAHNFNNLIGAILGHAEMAEGGIIAGTRVAQNLFEIRNAGDRARALVEQILDFGRPRHNQRAAVDIAALIAEAAALLKATLPPEIELEIRPVPAGVAVWGELAQLQQVVLNLCNNAAQAMARRGRIEIATTIDEVAGPLVLERGELAAGRHVVIAISDTGRGMTDAVVKRIFDPFYTTREAGNGLGLATVKEIVLDHGGAIQVRSTPGIGSRFEIWLPAAATNRPLVEMPAIQRSPDRMETVLLLDDNRERLERDEEILAAIGYEPVGFTRLADAIAACRSTPERFDALIVGQVAAAAKLTDLAASLHRQLPGRPILLATAAAEEADVPALTGSGVCELVSRPLNPAEIAAALDRCIAPATATSEVR